MSETQQISGICSEVSERGEWVTFHIDIGKQYPVKLSTKKEELVQLGRAASKEGGEFIWTYTETEGAENPHTGKPYINRYLEAVAPRDGGEQPPADPSNVVTSKGTLRTPAASATQPASRDERAQAEAVRQRLITRQTCIKAAAELLRLKDGTAEEMASDAIVAAAKFETWLYRDIDETPFY